MSKLGLGFLFLFLTMKCTLISDFNHRNFWITWNVGQGQWVSHIKADECLHYDIGGEKYSFYTIQTALKELCYSKLNRIFVSHWDQDHFLNLAIFARNFPKVCWQSKPLVATIANQTSHASQTSHVRRQKNHTSKGPWNKQSKSEIEAISLPIPMCSTATSTILWKPTLTSVFRKKFSKNDSSIVAWDEGVLAQGDSPIRQENIWSHKLSQLTKTKVLILGHHGSRTSTGPQLLQKLPHLQFAVASARWQKYHHPHAEVLKRLKNKKTPVLKTEDWGNIWFETF